MKNWSLLYINFWNCSFLNLYIVYYRITVRLNTLYSTVRLNAFLATIPLRTCIYYRTFEYLRELTFFNSSLFTIQPNAESESDCHATAAAINEHSEYNGPTVSCVSDELRGGGAREL